MRSFKDGNRVQLKQFSHLVSIVSNQHRPKAQYQENRYSSVGMCFY